MTAPFGIALGSTPDNYDAVYTVIFTNVPKSHPFFPIVVGQWIPKTGLCQINGYSHWSESGPYSLEIRSRYESIKDQLASRYGDYHDVQECTFTTARINCFECACLPSSAEIVTGVAWRTDTGAELPRDLDHIMLMVQALSDVEARISLAYAAFRDDISLSDVL